MKKSIFIVVLFLSVTFYAQPPGGGRGGSSQNRQEQNNKEGKKVKEFKASELAGVFYYDIDEVIKKIKVKKEQLDFEVRKALKDYNFEVKEISFLNSIKFNDLDAVVKSTTANKDREKGMEMRKKVNEILNPIREEIHQKEVKLNQKLEAILSEKQQKKWLKYQDKIKESIQPQKFNKDKNQDSRPNSGRRRQ